MFGGLPPKAALNRKLKGLEILTRNSATTETIEKQFNDVVQQSQRIGRMARDSWADPTDPESESDH